MKIITFNANGIRAAARKGFFEWLAHEQADADFICIQELKAQEDQLLDEIFHPTGYCCEYYGAEKKGYSGTAIYSKHKPMAVHRGLGWNPADSEGRYIQMDFKKLSIASLYMPSGSSSEERQQIKFEFLDEFYKHLLAWRKDKKREFIICADWNICHKEIDLKNWKANQKNSGFLPEERAWLDKVYAEAGWTDSFRVINQESDQYTWWSNRGQAYAKNVGWRLDYQLITPGLKSKILKAEIYKDQRFSDHAPQIMEYDLSI